MSFCKYPKCFEDAEQGSDFCIKHIRRCKASGCSKQVPINASYCKEHKNCCVRGCTQKANGDHCMCAMHTAAFEAAQTKECEIKGCHNKAPKGNRYCARHETQVHEKMYSEGYLKSGHVFEGGGKRRERGPDHRELTRQTKYGIPE